MSTADYITSTSRRHPGLQFVAGILLIAIWWPIAWLQLRPISDYYFFPLWLGYVLTIDGLVEYRTGSSLWRRSHTKFVFLFFVSIPFWWLFEWMNTYLQNWHYHYPGEISDLRYVLLSSLSFSVVVPAVLGTSELVASFRLGERLPSPPAWDVQAFGRIAFFVLGCIMLALVVLFPRYAFPLAWLSIFFIIEPINAAIGQRSLSGYVARGNWAAVWNVMIGTVITGFFWEMWNLYAMPKWTYSVPFVEFGHIFEMPILGYLGYIPFGMEVFAIYAIVMWLVERRPQTYARASANEISV